MSQSGTVILQSGGLPSDVPTQFVTDAGTAIPLAHVLFVNGAGGATTSVGASNQIIITASATGGDVSGPASAVNNDFASFDGITGKLIKDSGFSDSSFFKVANNLSEGVPATMRTNLGLGTLAILNSPLGPTNGGTGQTTYTKGDTLYASAANTLSKLAATTDGFVLTLASGIPSWAALPAGGVTSITGTANQVLANATSGSPETGAVTLTTPQNIATTSDVTFNSVQVANGLVGAPSYTFSNDPTTGFFLNSVGVGELVANGSYVAAFSQFNFNMNVKASFQALSVSGLSLYVDPQSASYGADFFDDYIPVDTVGGAYTITLPAAPHLGKIYIIKDQTGHAAANNITLQSSGGVLIDGAATALIATNYGSLSVIFDGTNYGIW